MRFRGSRRATAAAVLAVLVAVLAISQLRHGGHAAAVAQTPVEEAWRDRRSGVMVEVTGTVRKELSPDNKGARHQRFLLALPSGHTLLVAHNIDLAPLVPLGVGDQVTVHGQYEWNEQGGVVHWTHHDPDGRHEDGWILWDGHRYR